MRANIIVLFLALLLTGCGGGSSGANGSNPFGNSGDPVLALSLEVLDANCATADDNTFSADQDICVQASLTSDGTVSADQVVSFSLGAAIGSLSSSTALTNSSGVAQVIISNDGAATGATSVTATFSTATASANFEYVAADQVDTAPAINMEMIVSGSTGNRFRVGESVALRSIILSSTGTPITDEIVTFAVNGGNFTITPTDALTDATGTARATMTASDSDVGANILTVSITLDGITYSNTLNFEVLEPDVDQAPSNLSLAILDESCTSPNQSFGTNEILCLQATLSQNDTGVANEIVNFAISTDLGSLSASTALTNSNGVATVSINNATESIGAATATASFDDLSDSVNYEFVAVAETITNSPEITTQVILTGNPVNGFQAGETAIARATVIDSNGEPVNNAIVSFSIQGSGPVLSPTTALTNISGVAEVDLSATETDLGAYAIQAQATINDILISNSMNFEVRSAGAVVDSETRFGHFNNDGVFVEGIVGSSIADENNDVVISAGATTGFDVALVDENDQRITTPTPISFTSTCVANGEATIDEAVTTINGVASATFEDLSCAGSTGNMDQIVASVVVNNVTIPITREISILPEGIGSIAFVSATPDSIVLSGTGGQNNASVSTLLFQVNGELGNPLAQQEVSFALNTNAGGLRLDPSSGLTNSSGQVSTRVTAGTVPSPVRVTASVVASEGNTIRTQSDLLTVNTGLPDQNSFTLSASTLNPEAAQFSGVQSTITVRLSDSFNNPVPNGTTVNFTTESGSIDGDCRTGADDNGVIDETAAPTGTCSVTWTSTSPVVPDHRSTILAYAIGHETLFDANGNNAYDDEDGGPILDGTDSGFTVSGYGQVGFIDHSEAWRDDDEDGIRDESEPFIPFNDNNAFDAADGLFNGPQCNSETLCDSNAASIHIRRALVLVTSSSTALWRIYVNDISNDDNIIATNDSSVTITNSEVLNQGIYSVDDGASDNLIIVYYDTAGQVLPFETQLGTIDANGDISVVVDRVNNTNQNESNLVPGSVHLLANQENVSGTGDSSTVDYNLTIETPQGIRTNVNFSVRLD